MSEFEDFIKAKYPVDYESLKEKYPNVPVVEFYGDELDVWNHQQSKITQLKAQLNNMEQCYIEKKKQVDAVEHVLGCAMIGPKEVFAYASRIQEALRVSDDKLLNR